MAQGFISYSHNDNEPLGPSGERWVEKFHTDLNGRLRTKGGSLWYDRRIPSNEVIPDAVFAALQSSDFFFAVASRNFLKSGWCQSELAEFLLLCANQGHNDKERVFRVEIDQIGLDALNGLQNAVGYSFLHQTGERMHLLYSLELEYWNRIRDIECDFGKALQKLAPAKEPVRPVFLPNCRLRAAAERDCLKRHLEVHGFETRPEYTADCLLAVHVLGGDPPLVPIVPRECPSIVWITPGNADAPHAKELRESKRSGLDYQIVTGLASEVKEIVSGYLKGGPASKVAAEDDNHVYLICDSTEQASAIQARADIEKAGYRVDLPLFAGQPETIRQAHENSLRSARAALVLWNSGDNPGWLSAKIRELRRAMGLGRAKPIEPAKVLTSRSDEFPFDDHSIGVVSSVQEFIRLLAPPDGEPS